MKKILFFLIVFFCVSEVAVADPFVATYFEARKIFEGNGGPWMSAYSDLGVYFPIYSSGNEFGLEGQYNIFGPVSLGGKFLSQYPDWTSKNNYYLGPTAQLKFGNSFSNGIMFDVTFRFVPLIDVDKGKVGRYEFYSIFVLEYKKLQIIPAFFYFHANDFVWNSDSDQFTTQMEIAFKLYYKRLMVLIRPEYSKVKSYDAKGSKVADIDVVTIPMGLKGEYPTKPVIFWWQISAGPQKRSDSDTGAAVFLSGGGRF